MHRTTINVATEAHSEEVGWSYAAGKQHLHHTGRISKPKLSRSISYIL